MVNLAGRTLQYGPLKFKVDSVSKLFCDLSRTVFNFYASKNLKHFYNLSYVLKRANELKNDFKLTRFAFEVPQKFQGVPRE